MTVKFHILQSNGALAGRYKKLVPLLNNTAKTCAAKLTLADIDVVVMNVPWNVIPRTGINGFCYDAHQIILWLDCSHHYLQANFESTVRATLAHELHHCARSLARGTSHSSTYGGSLVAEGLACCFEEEIGENIPFYAIECTGEALQKFGDKAKQNVHKNREKLFGGWRQWVFGINNDPEFPYQCGYSTGYSLVRGWLNKTGSTASAAVGIDENEILDMWLDGQIELIGY